MHLTRRAFAKPRLVDSCTRDYAPACNAVMLQNAGNNIPEFKSLGDSHPYKCRCKRSCNCQGARLYFFSVTQFVPLSICRVSGFSSMERVFTLPSPSISPPSLRSSLVSPLSPFPSMLRRHSRSLTLFFFLSLSIISSLSRVKHVERVEERVRERGREKGGTRVSRVSVYIRRNACTVGTRIRTRSKGRTFV